MDMIASQLGTWIVGPKYEDLPPQVVTRAKFYGLTEGLCHGNKLSRSCGGSMHWRRFKMYRNSSSRYVGESIASGGTFFHPEIRSEV